MEGGVGGGGIGGIGGSAEAAAHAVGVGAGFNMCAALFTATDGDGLCAALTAVLELSDSDIAAIDKAVLTAGSRYVKAKTEGVWTREAAAIFGQVLKRMKEVRSEEKTA